MMQKYGISMDDQNLDKILKEAGVSNLSELYGSSATATSGIMSILLVVLAAVFML